MTVSFRAREQLAAVCAVGEPGLQHFGQGNRSQRQQ